MSDVFLAWSSLDEYVYLVCGDNSIFLNFNLKKVDIMRELHTIDDKYGGWERGNNFRTIFTGKDKDVLIVVIPIVMLRSTPDVEA